MATDCQQLGAASSAELPLHPLHGASRLALHQSRRMGWLPQAPARHLLCSETAAWRMGRMAQQCWCEPRPGWLVLVRARRSQQGMGGPIDAAGKAAAADGGWRGPMGGYRRAMLRNCPQCGRLLTTPPGAPCPACLAEEEDALRRVSAYLEAGGSPTFAAVAAGTGLPTRLIRRLVDTGRLVLGGEGATGLCSVCGRPVSGPGRLCPACARRLQRRAGGGPSDDRVAGYHSHRLPRPHLP